MTRGRAPVLGGPLRKARSDVRRFKSGAAPTAEVDSADIAAGRRGVSTVSKRRKRQCRTPLVRCEHETKAAGTSSSAMGRGAERRGAQAEVGAEKCAARHAEAVAERHAPRDAAAA